MDSNTTPDEPGGDSPQAKPRLREGSSQQWRELMNDLNDTMDRQDEIADEDLTNQAPIVRLANAIITNAIEANSSEIRLEPNPKCIEVRCRVHGALREIMRMPRFIQPPLFQRFLVMADIPFWKARHEPQSGEIPIRHGKANYILYLSSLPSLNGPTLRLRIFEDALPMQGRRELGLSGTMCGRIDDSLAAPDSGLFVLSAPSAEGKTTTAYALLRQFNDVERNIGTMEERRTYTLAGVMQTYAVGQGGRETPFGARAEAMRRQGVETLFVDDADTPEKAKIALELAEEGMSVLIALTATDVIAALERLIRLGIAPHRLAYLLRGVLHQRLVNKICPYCAAPDAAPLTACGWEYVTPSRGAGCERCQQTGVQGRIAAFSFLGISPTAEEALARDGRGAELHQALQSGVTPLEDDLREKAQEGVIPLSEAERVLRRRLS